MLALKGFATSLLVLGVFPPGKMKIRCFGGEGGQKAFPSIPMGLAARNCSFPLFVGAARPASSDITSNQADFCLIGQ